jgi:hemoglobin-like flavoprotein
MDTTNNIRTAQRQNVVVALQIASVIAESLASVAPLIEAVLLDHGAHRTVEEHYALLQQLLQTLEARAALDLIYWSHSKRRCRYARRSAFRSGIE